MKSMNLKTIGAILGSVFLFGAALPVRADVRVVLPVPPVPVPQVVVPAPVPAPAPVPEYVGPPPYSGDVWINGQWIWHPEHHRYEWHNGYWRHNGYWHGDRGWRR